MFSQTIRTAQCSKISIEHISCDKGAAKESHGLTFFTPFWNKHGFRLCFMIVDAFEDCLVGNTLSRVTVIALLYRPDCYLPIISRPSDMHDAFRAGLGEHLGPT
jgi:hypothetical protein